MQAQLELTICPCRVLETGLTLSYNQCCARFHRGEIAPTAEILMRSRYSAFVLGLEDYLFITWHPKTRNEGPYTSAHTKWHGLKVIDSGEIDSKHYFVEFIAYYSELSETEQFALHEKSSFELRAGRWLYIDGEFS